MCGIFGIIHPDCNQKSEALNRMSQSLTHRGPDDEGLYFFPKAALGHCRLNIIDLESGNQPMLADNGKIGITFNGEIYGFKDIKRHLAFEFKTSSDTEVILALYQKFGSKMLPHLPGMFAFALWDEKKQKLFCARDRFGEKPFYYAIGTNNEFLFASEIKAILASGLVSDEICVPSLIHYLKRLYIHPGESVYRHIHSLPPGHILEFSSEGLCINKYWAPPQEEKKLSLSEASEEFSFLFKQAVQRQLIADVPVGAFLSGGLDSTTIVSEAVKNYSDFRTFTFGFNNEFNNELEYAKATADQYQTNHTELEENVDEIGELLVKMQSIYDEPFADSSCIPTYLISKSASREMKVVLSGDGGDELLAGYTKWYQPVESLEKYLNKKNLYSRFLHKLGYKSAVSEEIDSSVIKHRSVSELHNTQRDYFNYQDFIEFGFDPADIQHFSENPETLKEVINCDITHYLPGDLLVKVDRASMANSLEIRSPFLDMDLAAFCMTLPVEMKINNGVGKYLLRNAYGKIWPPKIRKRDKMGFGAPVHQWLKMQDLIELKNEYLLNRNKTIYDFLEFNKVMEISQKSNYQEWIVLNLSLWLEHRKRS
jgi:asparagine synthase (glutamine-hydrolysing)